MSLKRLALRIAPGLVLSLIAFTLDIFRRVHPDYGDAPAHRAERTERDRTLLYLQFTMIASLSGVFVITVYRGAKAARKRGV